MLTMIPKLKFPAVKMNKKGFVALWGDVFKGFFVGLIVGMIVAVLIFYNVIPLNIKFCG